MSNHLKPLPPTEGGDWCRIEARASDEAGESSADVYIYNEIGYWGTTAKDFAAQIADLDVDLINLYVNSPGGSAWDGVAIMNVLRRHRARVEVTVDGLAASAASLICMAGDHVVMAASAQMMIHDASGLAWGNAQTMHETAVLLDKLSDSYADAYAKRAGGSRTQWRDVMRAETWFTAEETVLAGLADEWDGSRESAAAAAFDLTNFVYPGRSAAPAPTLPAAVASHIPPASSEPGSTTQKELDDMSYESLTAGLRERLGITEASVSDESILSALDEALAEQTDPAAQPAAQVPEGLTLIDTSQLASLQASAARIDTIERERASERREALVTAAVDDGRIPPARRDHWLAQLSADEEGMAPILAQLPSVIPVTEIGHSDDVDTAEDAAYAKYYPTNEKGA